MKKLFLLFTMSLLASRLLTAQEIKLPKPHLTGGMPLMEALNNRQSTREFLEKKIDMQNLSNLLWSAWGFNRESGKRTAPSSQNFRKLTFILSWPMDSLFTMPLIIALLS